MFKTARRTDVHPDRQAHHRRGLTDGANCNQNQIQRPADSADTRGKAAYMAQPGSADVGFAATATALSDSPRHPAQSEGVGSVKRVLDAAAKSIGGAGGEAEAVLARLEEQGVVHAWQLQHIEREDWAAAGASLGLRAAVQARLANQIVENLNPRCVPRPPTSDTDAMTLAMTPFQKRFLLLRSSSEGNAGSAPSSLGAIGATLYGTLLTVPGSEKQQLYLASGELLGVLSGLLVFVPMEFLREPDGEPSMEDSAFNAVAMVSFLSFLTSLLASLLAAMMAVNQGWGAADSFYEGLNSMLSTSFLCFVFGFWTLVVEVCWMAMEMCGEYVRWVPVVAFLGLFQWTMYKWAQVWVNELPLELFHVPAIFRWQFMLHSPLNLVRMRGKRLREAAEARGLMLGRSLALQRGEPI